MRSKPLTLALVIASLVLLSIGLLSACRGRSPLPPETACPSLYQPVCGRDGKTYQNACEARKAGQVTTATGECSSPSL